MPIRLDWVRVQHFMRLRGIEDVNELAVLAETHSTSMYRVATGKSLPQMETLARMCFHLGCQPGDLLAYEHSEDDLSKPHLLFGLFPINPQVWKRFRQLDRHWRKSIGRWELESSEDMVSFYLNGALGSKWKGVIPESVPGGDGKLVPLDFGEVLRLVLTDPSDGRPSAVVSFSDNAEKYATSKIVDAIAESFFKYVWTVNKPNPGVTRPDDDFETLDQLEAVYKKDPGVLEARSTYQAYHKNDAINIGSLKGLKAARFGCEIERDWHMLSLYAYANDVDDFIDYAEHHVKPIHNMDKEISQFDRWIKNYDLDKAIAEDMAQGMDDKED